MTCRKHWPPLSHDEIDRPCISGQVVRCDRSGAGRATAPSGGFGPFRDFVAAGLQRIDKSGAENTLLCTDAVSDVRIVDIRADQAGDGIDIGNARLNSRERFRRGVCVRAAFVAGDDRVGRIRSSVILESDGHRRPCIGG